MSSRESPPSPSRRPMRLGRDQALEKSVQSTVTALEEGLSRTIQHGVAADYQTLQIDEVHPDPDNPRWAECGPTPTWEEIQNPAIVSDPEKRAAIESIHELAATMRADSVGQRQPIEVWRSAGFYQIITGERRYWALRMCGELRIKAMVLPERPRRHRLVQYVENFHHHSPALRQQVSNLRSVIKEAEVLSEPITNGAQFAERVGFARATAFRWWSIVNAPQDVLDAIRDRRITSSVDAASIAQVKDEQERQRLIADPKARLSTVETTSAPAVPTPRGRGRPSQSVSFGKTASLPLAKAVILKINPKAAHQQVNWQDFKAVNKLWKTTLQQFEKNLQK